MPKDADEAIGAVLKAVRSGRLNRKRIDESVAKILAAKARLGLARRRTVDLNLVADTLESQPAGRSRPSDGGAGGHAREKRRRRSAAP